MKIAIWYKDHLVYEIPEEDLADFNVKDIEILESENGETWDILSPKDGDKKI